MTWLTSKVTMVASHLLLVNHFLLGLTYNSPEMSSFHPNAIDGVLGYRSSSARDQQHRLLSARDQKHRSSSVRDQHHRSLSARDQRHFPRPPMVSYNLAGQTELETNSIAVTVSSCGYGCSQCSTINGCLSCRPPFFLTLRRDGLRQLAHCERSCPTGFYKRRYNNKRFCASCRQQGCQLCRRAGQCRVCDEGYWLDGGTGVCSRSEGNIRDGTETPVSRNALEFRPVVYPPVLLTDQRGDPQTSTEVRRNRKRLRNYRRKISYRKKVNMRRRNRRRRRPHRRRKARKHKQRRPNAPHDKVPEHPHPEISSSSHRPVNTGRNENFQPNQKQNRTRQLGNRIQRRRRNRRRKKRRRKQQQGNQQHLRRSQVNGQPSTNFGTPVAERPQLADDFQSMNWRNFHPQVRLARPSRHIRKQMKNATVTDATSPSQTLPINTANISNQLPPESKQINNVTVSAVHNNEGLPIHTANISKIHLPVDRGLVTGTSGNDGGSRNQLDRYKKSPVRRKHSRRNPRWRRRRRPRTKGITRQ